MFDFITIGNGSSFAKLLTLDETITILADPGWNGSDSLDFYSQYVNSIDMIILSQTTTDYIGGYIYLLNNYPILRNIPTYSTLPISKLGRVSTCELYRSIGILGPVDGNIIEVDDILKYFNNIKCLNYSQNIHLSHINNKLTNLSLTPYNSGYSIGGSIWLIENNINEKIIYAPIWNHSKDEFLNNCKIFNNSDFIRPTTLITNSDYISTKYSHSNRIESFLNLIQKNLDNGTNVLLPTTLTGRFFELIIPILLNKKINCNIYLINYTGFENLKILSNFLEWMNQSIIKLWENENQSEILFENNRIQLIKFEDLENLVSTTEFQRTPKIFFVEEMNLLDGSFFNQFLIDMNSKLSYTMILTEKPNLNSKLNQFFKIWKQNVDATTYDPKESTLIVLEIPDVRMTSIKDEILRGKELAAYLKRVKEKKEIKAKLEKEEFERKKIEEILDNDVKVETDSEEEDDEDNAEKILDNLDNDINKKIQGNNNKDSNNGNINMNIDKNNNTNSEIMANIIKIAEMKFQIDDSKRLKMDEIMALPRDFDVRNLKHKNRVFPFVNNRYNIDDYGIVIKADDFQIFDDDRFPIFNNNNNNNDENEIQNGDGDQNQNQIYSNDSKIEEDINGKRIRNGGNNRIKRNKHNFDNNNNNNENKKSNNTENALYRPPVYSLESTIDPVTREKTTKNITIRCGISFIDLSGNHDLRSLKFTIKKIQPRKVIILPSLINNSDNLMKELSNDTKQNILSGNSNSSNIDIEYIKSNINKKINLGEVITSYELLLDEKLASKLKWQSLNDGYSVSSVSGIIEKLKDWEFKLKESENLKFNSTLTKIGDVKLAQLRKSLGSNKHRVELMGDGRLVVDDELIIGKANDGNLSIEGGLGNLFYEVKNLIEGMLANV